MQLGRDLVVECSKGDDPLSSKLASSLLEAFDSSSSRSTTPPLLSHSLSHSSSPLLKSRDARTSNVHVNTFRY